MVDLQAARFRSSVTDANLLRSCPKSIVPAEKSYFTDIASSPGPAPQAVGMVLESLKQPVINGYLIAGSLVGPGGLKLVKVPRHHA